MNRYPGLVACDLETGNVWVCIGGSDAIGWQWCWVGPTGGTFYALECPDDVHGHPSFKRALAWKAGQDLVQLDKLTALENRVKALAVKVLGANYVTRNQGYSVFSLAAMDDILEMHRLKAGVT